MIAYTTAPPSVYTAAQPLVVAQAAAVAPAASAARSSTESRQASGPVPGCTAYPATAVSAMTTPMRSLKRLKISLTADDMVRSRSSVGAAPAAPTVHGLRAQLSPHTVDRYFQLTK